MLLFLPFYFLFWLVHVKECQNSIICKYKILTYFCSSFGKVIKWINYAMENWVLLYSSDSSVGKESPCNSWDPGLIPRSGRSAGAGMSYPPQYSWASLVAKMVKNLLTLRETWVRSLVWGDPLEKGTATHSSVLAWRIPMDRGAWRAIVQGVTKSQTWLSD